MSSSTTWLPKFILIKSNIYKEAGHAYYSKGNPVLLGEPNVFSTLVKIEAERAKINDKYVNLRFCSSNKYWQKSADDNSIVAVSNKTEEDTTNPACTLFEPVKVDDDNNTGDFYLTHVQTGGRLLIDNSTMAFHVQNNYNGDEGGYLSFTDWNTVVYLPERVAFKGDNDKYLQAFFGDHKYLMFKGDDPYDSLSGYTITLLPDGHLLIKSDYAGMYCYHSSESESNWILAEIPESALEVALLTGSKAIRFWPVKIDDTTIALRSTGNNKFCKRLIAEMENCLSASSSTMAEFTRLTVKELVSSRKIYNVRYRMEDARIYDESPFSAGNSTVHNEGDTDATMTVEISYEDSRSYSFNTSVSITAGVSNTIQAGIPEIASESITVSFETTIATEWGTTTTNTTSSTGTISVVVPPRSQTKVSYVATMGTCDVPFSYTLEDTSSVDGRIYTNDKIDGVYTGTNLYNFNFVVEKARPLG